MRTHFKTKAGTELPIINLRGKEYLEVKYRLVWFREENPKYGIRTEIVSHSDKSATVKASITSEQGFTLAMGHKTEDTNGFSDFLEKAETGAIGRALAVLGYGTQFASDDLDEAHRVVDAPVVPKKFTPTIDRLKQESQYICDFGLSYKGQTLDQIGQTKAIAYAERLVQNAKDKNQDVTGPAKKFLDEVFKKWPMPPQLNQNEDIK